MKKAKCSLAIFSLIFLMAVLCTGLVLTESPGATVHDGARLLPSPSPFLASGPLTSYQADVDNQSSDSNGTFARGPANANDPLPFYIVSFLFLAVGTAVLVALSWPIEAIIVSLLSIPVLLYSRLADHDPLDNYRRGQIHGFVLAHPGVSFSELRRRLGIPNGTLVYHLHVLEKENVIRSKRAGNLVLYFSSESRTTEISESMWTELQLKIMMAVAEAGEIKKADLRHSIGCSHQLLHYNLKKMVASDVLATGFRNGRIHYSLAPESAEAVREMLARRHGGGTEGSSVTVSKDEIPAGK